MYRSTALVCLGKAFRPSQPEEALQVFETYLALFRRRWPQAKEVITMAQSDLACCLNEVGRHDEAVVLMRGIYARRVAMHGAAHEDTISSGQCLAVSLNTIELWSEAKTLTRDQLLPAAERSLGADSHTTLMLKHNLVQVLAQDPACTRDDLCV